MNRSVAWASLGLCLLVGGAAGAQPAELILDWPVGTSNGTETVKGLGFEIMQRYENHHDCITPEHGRWKIHENEEVDEWYCIYRAPHSYCCAREDPAAIPETVTGDSYRVHAGIDFVASQAGATVGAPAYAVADGVVRCRLEPADINYPGGVVVIEHTLADEDTYRYSMYGHVDDIAVSVNDLVSRGERIANITDQTRFADHLHFEWRDRLQMPELGCAGRGYTDPDGDDPDDATTEGYLDFVNAYYLGDHRPAFPLMVSTSATAEVNIRDAATADGEPVTSPAALRARLPALSLVRDTGGGDKWWYEVRYDQSRTGYVAAYNVGSAWSGEIYSTEIRPAIDQDPFACGCEGGTDSNLESIPLANTFCGYQPCGADNEYYMCLYDDWYFLGDGPCSMPVPIEPLPCTCYDGVLFGGDPIDPASTFCGMEVCGADNESYRCELGGWRFIGGGPCA